MKVNRNDIEEEAMRESSLLLSTFFKQVWHVLKYNKIWLISWIGLPIAFPNWLLYTLFYHSFLNHTKQARGFDLLKMRGNIPAVINGATLWFTLITLTYWLIKLLEKSHLFNWLVT